MDLSIGAHRRIRSSVAIGLSAAMLLLVYMLLPVRSAAARGIEAHAQGTYLALGDSLAFGYSQLLFEEHERAESPTYFEHGYVNDFAEALRRTRPHLRIVNDGCPGETTTSMIKGPCAYQAGTPLQEGHPLHHPYVGGPSSSQLSDALAYLHAHRGQVNPITIDIGANDVLAMLRSCQGSGHLQACIAVKIPGLFERIAGNLGFILSELRAAAPHAQIIVLGLYNPFGSAIPGGNQLAEALNEQMQKVAAGTGARFADPLPLFNPTVLDPESKLLQAKEALDICSLTYMCASKAVRIHPQPLGYEVLAGSILRQYIMGLLPGREHGEVRKLEGTGLLALLEGYGG